MSGTPQVLAARRATLNRPRRRFWPRHLRGSEFAWAIAFVVPYATVFFAFVVYPVAYGLWMAREPSLYRDLAANPLYARTVVNTMLYVGLGVNVKMFLVLLLSGFFMRRRWSSFLVIPVFRLMASYGLSNSLWAIVAANVTFAAPYAILILQQYATLIPMELDEAARVEGASPVQVYRRIYLLLMTPALAAVGTYALLLAWNEYLYQYLLLSSTRNMTVAVGIAQFFNSDEAPWNYMMATAIIYAVPPIVIFYALRRDLAAGLTRGTVRG